MTNILTVVNFKGGAAKTTTTAYLAHAFAAQGKKVLIVDADPQQSLQRWAARGDWEIPIIGKPVPKLHLTLRGVIGTRYDIVLVDTPGMDDKAGIVMGALRAADSVLVPMNATLIDLERLAGDDERRGTWDAIEEAKDYKDGDLPHTILLNRTVPNTIAPNAIRAALRAQGHRVLESTIPQRQAIGLGYGKPVTDLFGHDQVAAELEAEEVK